jgi:hypothetical protein
MRLPYYDFTTAQGAEMFNGGLEWKAPEFGIF